MRVDVVLVFPDARELSARIMWLGTERIAVLKNTRTSGERKRRS